MRILVFNFFLGIKDRGIPLYARELVESLEKIGVEVVELKCPVLFSRAPNPVLNLLFALYEQLVAPSLRCLRRCDLAIYPYNSVGLIDTLGGRALLVVHDLIPNGRHARGAAAFYIRVTQRLHVALARPIATVSDHVLATLRKIPRFARCPLYLSRNAFHAFHRELERRTDMPPRSASEEPRARRILLCSGIGKNKDFSGAIQLFRLHGGDEIKLRIVGFGDDAYLAQRRIDHLPDTVRRSIVILPRLTLAELVDEYIAADMVWVHSAKEGFGRPVIESRLVGRPVLASNISAFRRLAHLGQVHLYRTDTFARALGRVLASADDAEPVTLDGIHGPIEAELTQLFERQFGATFQANRPA